jgi:hypothetical protein
VKVGLFPSASPFISREEKEEGGDEIVAKMMKNFSSANDIDAKICYDSEAVAWIMTAVGMRMQRRRLPLVLLLRQPSSECLVR